MTLFDRGFSSGGGGKCDECGEYHGSAECHGCEDIGPVRERGGVLLCGYCYDIELGTLVTLRRANQHRS